MSVMDRLSGKPRLVGTAPQRDGTTRNAVDRVSALLDAAGSSGSHGSPGIARALPRRPAREA